MVVFVLVKERMAIMMIDGKYDDDNDGDDYSDNGNNEVDDEVVDHYNDGDDDSTDDNDNNDNDDYDDESDGYDNDDHDNKIGDDDNNNNDIFFKKMLAKEALYCRWNKVIQQCLARKSIYLLH